MINSRRLSLIAVAVILGLSIISLSHPASRSYLSGYIPEGKAPGGTSIPELPKADTGALQLPSEYTHAGHQSEFCADRFSTKYLERLRDHARSYCATGSQSNLTCFHHHNKQNYADQEDRVDSVCLGRGAVLDLARGRYGLDCALRPFEETEKAQGLIPFQGLRSYWYETGAGIIFDQFTELDTAPTNIEAARAVVSAGLPSPRFQLLLKREGETNPWHCLMEIYSAWMSVDVLRMARDPLNNNRPFFQHPEDTHDTQVVILDDRDDGPYFNLWQLFAERTPVRLSKLMSEHVAGSPSVSAETTIIIPMAGASNPMWQNDWEVRDCSEAQTLRVFAQRVLGFYRIEDQPRDPDQIMVTFVDRQETRKLLDKDELFEALQATTPHIKVQTVDFAAISFPEQLRVIRDTDVLVGVHGAGLTHTMFMRENLGAIVELQPETMRDPQTGQTHNGFRNLANMLRLNYFRIHVPQVPAPPDEKARSDRRSLYGKRTVEKRASWHVDNVKVDKDRFLEVVSMAIKAMYTKGIRNLDVD
jgi:protein O-GlcNAc transferase